MYLTLCHAEGLIIQGIQSLVELQHIRDMQFPSDQLHHRNMYFATYKHINSLQKKKKKKSTFTKKKKKKNPNEGHTDFPECGKSDQFPERDEDEAALLVFGSRRNIFKSYLYDAQSFYAFKEYY